MTSSQHDLPHQLIADTNPVLLQVLKEKRERVELVRVWQNKWVRGREKMRWKGLCKNCSFKNSKITRKSHNGSSAKGTKIEVIIIKKSKDMLQYKGFKSLCVKKGVNGKEDSCEKLLLLSNGINIDIMLIMLYKLKCVCGVTEWAFCCHYHDGSLFRLSSAVERLLAFKWNDRVLSRMLVTFTPN